MGRSQVAYEQEVKEEAARHLAEAGRKAAELDVACETIEVENEHPYRAIIETAIQRGCDLITMASHALTAPVTTSQTLSVLAHSDIPVLVYR